MNNHIAIPVKNLEESKKFYEQLGFTVFGKWGKPERELEAIGMHDASGYKIELTYHPKNKNLIFPEIIEVQHLGIEVENLELKLEELQRGGIIVSIPITKGVSVKQFAFIKDPNGFSVELVEYEKN